MQGTQSLSCLTACLNDSAQSLLHCPKIASSIFKTWGSCQCPPPPLIDPSSGWGSVEGLGKVQQVFGGHNWLLTSQQEKGKDKRGFLRPPSVDCPSDFTGLSGGRFSHYMRGQAVRKTQHTLEVDSKASYCQDTGDKRNCDLVCDIQQEAVVESCQRSIAQLSVTFTRAILLLPGI